MAKILVCLELGGRVLHEVRSDEFQGPISIGRGVDAAWSVAGVDPSMSARHAELFRRRGALWLRDLGSRNGVTFAGERIESRRLRPGDKLHLGACTLSVEAIVERDPRDILAHHRLEQLNGPGAGRIVELEGPADIHVGSDPSSDILCADPLVSHKQAVLSLRADGSVWVNDLGSRNGTSVNGDPLRKGKERMLRDGDIVSFAYVEFRFTDKDAVHPRAHLLRKAGAAAATVALVLIAWYVYASVRPSARTLLRRSLDLASAARFAEAESLARQSADARGAMAYARRRVEILRNIEAWRETQAAGVALAKFLADRNWDRAQTESVHLRDWNWNATDAPRAGVRAERALALVHALRSAQRALADGDGAEVLAAESAALSDVATALRDVAPTNDHPWAAPLLSDIARVLPEIDATTRELESVESIAASLRPASDDTLPTVAQTALERIDALLSSNLVRRSATPADAPYRPSRAVADRIGEIHPPLKALVASEQTFASNVICIAAADFGRVTPDLPLPSAQLSATHPAFAAYAADLGQRQGVLVGQVLVGWQSRLRGLAATGLDAASHRRPTDLEKLLAPATAVHILAFVPSPSLPLPRPGDDAPVPRCSYDSALGIFDIVYFLDQLTDDDDTGVVRAASQYGKDNAKEWSTTVEAVRAVQDLLRGFCAYENASGRVGALARLVARAQGGPNRIAETLRFADELLGEADVWAIETFPEVCRKEGSSRAGIVGRAVQLLLAESPDPDDAAALARDWRAFRASLPAWDGSETVARDIFNAALPGMGAHREAWKYLQDLAKQEKTQ